MAYSALISLQQNLEHIIQDPYHVLHHDREQPYMKSLLQSIPILQEFIEKHPRYCAECEDRITDTACDAEDILDNCISNILQFGRRNDHLASDVQPSTSGGRLDYFEEMSIVSATLQSIVDDVMKIHPELEAENVDAMDPLAITLSTTTEITSNEDIILGLEEESKELKHRLLGETCSPLEIISIVGMGGIGKTTLARTTYEDNAVIRHFDVRVWITVSQNYDQRSALLSLLDSSKESNQEVSNEQLAIHVHRRLKRRRYLVVLDDIWKADVWDDVRKFLPEDCNGSRVMVTTRQTDVADYANSYIHNMHLMDEDKSWDLLEKKVFGQGSCPLELADIGRFIVRRCRGLPLAIVVIAGILQVDQKSSSWKEIARDVTSATSKNAEHLFEILSLSYVYLPVRLRPCFLYLGGFVKDDEIPVSKLIKLWVAEGFVKSTGFKPLEEVAYEYLEDLIRRNLISSGKRKCVNGLLSTCYIHDALREMCSKQATEENFYYLVEGILNPRCTNISMYAKGGPYNIVFAPVHDTLYFYDTLVELDDDELNDLVEGLMATGDEDKLPSQVCQRIRLRYLDVTRECLPTMLKVPANICHLVNLQTLILRDEQIVVLPSEIWRMRSLRHLVVANGALLPPSSSSEEEHHLPLEGLQTLSRIIILMHDEKLMEMIPNIRKLGLQSLEEGECLLGHYIKHLIHLECLENLKLRLGRDSLSPDDWENIPILVRLRKLTIEGGYFDDMVRILGSGSLPNLEVLKLRQLACRDQMWEMEEENFPKLKMLEINNWDFQIWRMESSSHFPQLEHLKLYSCLNLEELPCCLGEVDTLQLIEVDDCNKNVVDWAKEIEEEQRDCGNESLQVRVEEKTTYFNDSPGDDHERPHEPNHERLHEPNHEQILSSEKEYLSLSLAYESEDDPLRKKELFGALISFLRRNYLMTEK